MLQKAMLTGAMCAIAPGSPVQLLVAMLVCLAYLVAIVFAGPYKGRLEDQLAFLTSLVLMLSLMLGFALITDRNPPVFDVDQLGWILIGMNVLPFLYLGLAVALVCRHGPNVGIRRQGAARGNAAASGNGGKVPLRGRATVRQRLTLSHVEQAVLHEKLTAFEKRHKKQHAAFLAATREREKLANARVKERLAERLAKRNAGEKLEEHRQLQQQSQQSDENATAATQKTSCSASVKRKTAVMPVAVPAGMHHRR